MIPKDNPWAEFLCPSNDAVIITRGNQHLSIVYDKRIGRLWKHFVPKCYEKWQEAESKMTDYINNHTEEAFCKAVFAADKNHFILNIADFLDFCPIENPDFYNSYTVRFIPIIKMFHEFGVKDEYLSGLE